MRGAKMIYKCVIIMKQIFKRYLQYVHESNICDVIVQNSEYDIQKLMFVPYLTCILFRLCQLSNTSLLKISSKRFGFE